MSSDTTSRSVASFRKDLKLLSDDEIISKYIYGGNVWYINNHLKLKDDDYVTAVDFFYQSVAGSFNVDFKSVIIVGSGKTGFSLNPSKGARSFDPHNSDIDVAIVSEKHFINYWSLMRTTTGMLQCRYYNDFASGIYKGYIPIIALKEVSSIRRDFDQFGDMANKAIQNRLEVSHKINYRIYRSWKDLDDYHKTGLRKFKLNK